MDSPLKLNSKMHKLLTQMHFLHKIHGTTVLFKDKNSSWFYRLYKKFITVALLTFTAMFICGSFSLTSYNKNFQRLICQVGSVTCLQIISQESLFILQKQKVMSLVQWCNDIDVYKPRYCNKPNSWFDSTQTRILFLIR